MDPSFEVAQVFLAQKQFSFFLPKAEHDINHPLCLKPYFTISQSKIISQNKQNHIYYSSLHYILQVNSIKEMQCKKRKRKKNLQFP